MKAKPVYVSELVKKFNLIVVCGDDQIDKVEVKTQEVNRPGLELLGFFEFSDLSRINLLGNKEFALMKSIKPKDLKERFDLLTSDKTPAIILTHGHICPPELLDLAKLKNFIILRTNQKTSLFQSEIMIYLNERKAPCVAIHASLLTIYGQGVLLIGESGIGKSEISLELLKRGHQLISDDRVDIYKIRDTLVGYSPDTLRGFMEVRGLGIINVERIFGINSVGESVKINYIINLIEFNKEYNFERLGSDMKKDNILNVEIPAIDLPVSTGRNMADLVEVAVTNLRIRDAGEQENFEINYEKFRQGIQ